MQKYKFLGMVVHTYMVAHTHNLSIEETETETETAGLGKFEVSFISVASSRLANDTLSQKIE